MAKTKKKLRKGARAVEKADAKVVRKVAPLRDTPPVEALSFVSKLGDQPPLRILCGGLVASGIATGSGRLVRAGTRALLAHSLATLAKNFVMHRVDRSRPERILGGNGSNRVKQGRRTGKAETSFPSGHSAGAIAVARAVSREFPEHQDKALAAAGLIAAAQVPRCSHYPTDVGAGLAIGLAAEALTDWGWTKAKRAL